jgi:hypothetical protein
MFPRKRLGSTPTDATVIRLACAQPHYALLLLAFVLSGCLPFSCGKKESRDLFPADSLSRALASTIPVDTLEAVDQLRLEPELLAYPRSISYSPDGILWVGDTKVHTIVGFDESGQVSQSLQFDELEYPYISGFRSDTLVVFTPENPRIVHVVDGEITKTIPVPQERPLGPGFQYATSYEGGYFYKVIDENFRGYIARLDPIGRETGRWILPGEYWRYAGALRMWSGSLLSLSGYLSQVHIVSEMSVLSPSVETPLDSLRLHGFDSPMLSRTRLFLLDELTQPPLLSVSAVGLGELLFVLNMRPGWLRVDVYDRSGELQYILTQPTPEFNTEYYPTDLAVRVVRTGRPGSGVSGGDNAGFAPGKIYELAVSLVKPEARIDRYLWRE